LIRLTCAWLWASETRGPDAAFVGIVGSSAANFNFDLGTRFWLLQSNNYTGGRALPVRSGK